jgi:tRNA/tmRNA/rRNA uracil-C5-methylase (TrmA/RlmC/RlmD family)
VLEGPDRVREHAAGRDWELAASGFWQVHPAAADALADCVLDFLAPAPGDTALDLYAGAGLFAGLLAAAVAPTGRVVAVESDPRAAADARSNLTLPPTPPAPSLGGDLARPTPGESARVGGAGGTPVVAAPVESGRVGGAGGTPVVAAPGESGTAGAGGTPVAAAPGESGTAGGAGGTPLVAAPGESGRAGVEVRAARVSVGLLGGLGIAPDVAVLDPPRAGAGPDVLTALLALRPRAVAYVSCDPAALARDLRAAVEAGWRLARLRAFDCFPMTQHVETVALLEPQ